MWCVGRKEDAAPWLQVPWLRVSVSVGCIHVVCGGGYSPEMHYNRVQIRALCKYWLKFGERVYACTFSKEWCYGKLNGNETITSSVKFPPLHHGRNFMYKLYQAVTKHLVNPRLVHIIEALDKGMVLIWEDACSYYRNSPINSPILRLAHWATFHNYVTITKHRFTRCFVTLEAVPWKSAPCSLPFHIAA